MNKTGFGFLRLPCNEEKVIQYDVLNTLVDRFLELGGTYFDTAYTYFKGESEVAIRKSLVERYPRSRYLLADKLPGYKVTAYEDCATFFEESLTRCGVDYFDVYLLHFLNEKNYAIAEQFDEFRFLREMKAQGKAKKIGFSFHDGPELLDRILTAHPEVDCVLLQINYLDWNSISIQSKRCYDTVVRHGKRVLVMEPVKGGNLVSLPENAEAVLRDMDPKASVPSWAIRFATDLQHVDVVLSGMNAMEQVEDNMQDFLPLSDAERQGLEKCADMIRAQTAVGCTGCEYCVPDCPRSIPIPTHFALYNERERYPNDTFKMKHAYRTLVSGGGKASDCIVCGMCEKSCPQKLPIRSLLKKVADTFEKE